MPDLSFITRLPIAHRGLHNADDNIVENSQGSILAATKNGYAIELDLQFSKDGQAIVFHDNTLDRMTNKTGNVDSFTLSELLQIQFLKTDEKIISFEHTLKLVNGQVPLIIELKNSTENIKNLVQTISQIIDNYDGEICVMSFNPIIINQFKKTAPHIIRGIVAEQKMLDEDWPGVNGLLKFIFKNLLYWPFIRPHFISYQQHDLPILCTKIARHFNVPIITWTVKTEKEAKLAYQHADQITFEGFFPIL